MAEQYNRKDLTPDQFKQLEGLAEIMCTKEEAAAFFDIDAETLLRNIKSHYKMNWKDFFERYSSNGKISVRRQQYLLAQKGDRVMLIWLGKQYLKQSDKIEQTSIDATSEKLKADLLEELRRSNFMPDEKA